VNAAATVEPPGHHACMLYAAMVCPYLARPNARRGQDVSITDFQATRGEPRGERDGIGGAVVGFASYEFRVDEFVMFHFAGLVACSPHRFGDEHLHELREAIEGETTARQAIEGEAAPSAAAPSEPAGKVESCPAYLLDDDSAARARAANYL